MGLALPVSHVLQPHETYNYDYINLELFIIPFTEQLIYLTNKKTPNYEYIDVIIENMKVKK